MSITLIPEDGKRDVELQDCVFFYRPLTDGEIQTITAANTVRGFVNVAGRRDGMLEAALTGWKGVRDENGEVEFDITLVKYLPSIIRETLENILFTGIELNNIDESKNS